MAVLLVDVASPAEFSVQCLSGVGTQEIQENGLQNDIDRFMISTMV